MLEARAAASENTTRLQLGDRRLQARTGHATGAAAPNGEPSGSAFTWDTSAGASLGQELEEHREKSHLDLPIEELVDEGIEPLLV